MSIWTWIVKFRQGRDAATMRRAAAEAVETPQERQISGGDVEGMQLDEEVAKLTGDTRSETERLGE